MESSYKSHFYYEQREHNHCYIGEAKSVLSFKNECLRAAKLIHVNRLGKQQVKLALSGGLDSECVALSFLKANIPFSAVIMKFTDDLNAHDIQYAIELCEKHSIQYEIVELNLKSFYKQNQHLYYAKKWACPSPQIATHLWLIENYPEPLVFSGNPIRAWLNESHQDQISPQSTQNQIYTINDVQLIDIPTENQICMDHLMKSLGRGVANFFLYTPELSIASVMEQDLLKNTLALQRDRLFVKENMSELSPFRQILFLDWLNKFRFYIQAGFGVQPKPNKFTGFESLHKELGEPITKPTDNQWTKEICGLNRFNELYRAPMRQLLGASKETFFHFGKHNKALIEARWRGSLTPNPALNDNFA